MAAGRRQDYRMLQEGQAELEAGRDVVDRAARDARPRRDGRAAPRASRSCRAGASTTAARRSRRWTCPAILARAPELVPDRRARAHQRARASSTRKRYEDVEDVLDAGIDVFSTVNVQHLESLNDQVAELTGVRVRETVPDAVLARADEVVLVDLTPEALLERLRAGKVYPRRARSTRR